MVIRKLLDSLGYKVLEAASVREALQIADQHLDSIDLLLTDVIMPGQRGTVLAEGIKNRSQRIKVLFMSGYADERIVHDGILNPGINFISKPITIRKLSEIVRHILDSK
jgi:DNA-binding NtrC family response regulator